MIESTVEEYLAWLEAAGHARDTVRSRRASLRRFSRWLAGQGVTEPTSITSALLERYRSVAAMRQHGFPPPLTVGSQIQALLAVKRFCAWCVRRGILDTDPAAEYVLPRRPYQLPRSVLSVRETEAVLAQPDVGTPTGLRDRAILETLYSTGIRRAELVALRGADVDAERGTLWVRQGKGGR
jgi:integrase/recombinase XerD